MSRISTTIISMAIVFALASCNDEPEGTNWGHTEYYEDFPLCNYEPVIMTDTLEIVLNNDAARFFNSDDAYIQLCVSSNQKEIVEPKDIIIYFDGKPCEDFKFSIAPKAQIGKEDSELDEYEYTVSGELGIEFKDEAEDGCHEYYIHYSDCACRSSLKLKGSNQEIHVSKNDLAREFEGAIENGIFATKETIYNPLAKSLTIIFIIFLLANLCWLLLFRNKFFNRFKIAKITLKGPAPYIQSLKVNGKYIKIVLTNKAKKQGFFEKYYKGEIKYLVNSLWTEEIEITPVNKNSIRVKPVKSGSIFRVDYSILKKGNICKLTNTETKNNTEITIN